MPKMKAMTAFQMLLMTQMRLRLNMAEQILAYEFSVSQTTVSRLFTDVIDVPYLRLKSFVYWPERDADAVSEIFRKESSCHYRLF